MAGHSAGAKNFRKIMTRCCERGISAATFYVFSTENWKRPKQKVDAILSLLDQYLDDCEKEVSDNDVRFIFIGDLSVFSDSIRQKIRHIEEISKNNKYIANLALNYGAKSELTMAVNKLISQGKEEICEQDIENNLYTKDSPALDLIVRTGGDLRLSNFLLWQAAYAEFYFVDKLWPDLTPKDVDKIIDSFGDRHRRYGGVEEEDK